MRVRRRPFSAVLSRIRVWPSCSCLLQEPRLRFATVVAPRIASLDHSEPTRRPAVSRLRTSPVRAHDCQAKRTLAQGRSSSTRLLAGLAVQVSPCKRRRADVALRYVATPPHAELTPWVPTRNLVELGSR
jgi:hypothetical protein